MSAFEVIEEGPPPSPRLQEANNSSGLNRVKMRRLETTTTDKNASARDQCQSQGRWAMPNSTKEFFESLLSYEQ